MEEPMKITMPSAPPELYLKGIQWGREAIEYATSAALPGRIPRKTRGTDPVLDLLLYDWPERVEAEALKAVEEGRAEIAPVLEIDRELLGQAHERGEAIWQSLQRMLKHGGPQADPDVIELRERSREYTEQALAETG
jgi:hypothetical protein